MRKAVFLLSSVIVVIIGAIILIGCPPSKQVCIRGRLVDHKSQPVEGARIALGGNKDMKPVLSSKDGTFSICVDPSIRIEKYVLNITKRGYGFASKIYRELPSEQKEGDTSKPEPEVEEITMTEATLTDIDPVADPRPQPDPTPEEATDPAPTPDPGEPVVTITDETPDMSPPISSTVDATTNPLATLPFVYDSNGRLISFNSPELGAVYDAAAQFQTPDIGASTTLNPNDLEETGEDATAGFFSFQQKNEGKITASISTVDIYGRDGMPGDYTVRRADESTSWMETYGAVDINFYRGGKVMKLKEGKYAIITIPVDTMAIISKAKLAPKVPLWVYKKETGEWERDKENMGILNKAGTAYVAKVSHFTVYNMDTDFSTNPACYRFCTNVPAPYNAELEVTVPPYHIKPFLGFDYGWGSPTDCPSICSGTGYYGHAIIRIQPNTPIGIRIREFGGNVVSTSVFIAGAGNPVTMPSCPYSTCAPAISLQVPYSSVCWMEAGGTGKMKGPVLAIQRGTGVNIDNFKFSWVYADALSSSANPPVNPDAPAIPTKTTYKLQYFEITNQGSAFDPLTPEASWSKINIGGGASETFQSTDWRVDLDLTVPGISTTNPVVFRVLVRTSGAFKSGVLYLLNDADGGQPFFLNYDPCAPVGSDAP